MDALPVELRLKVFGFALQAQRSFVWAEDIARKASSLERLGLSLFLVNRQTFAEALDAFYEVNSISIRRDVPTYFRLKLARHLEFNSLHLVLAAADPAGFREYMVKSFSKLPRLRTITLPQDLLGDSFATIRQRLLDNDLCATLEIRRIGLYALTPGMPLKGKVWVKDSQLWSAITQAQTIASSHSLSDLTMCHTISGFRRDVAGIVTCQAICELAFWLRAYEAMRGLKRDPHARLTQTAEDLRCVQVFEHSTHKWQTRLHTTPFLPAIHEDLPDNVSLVDLSSSAGHSPELLEWADRLLAYNFCYITR